jgi:hypothetical protein
MPNVAGKKFPYTKKGMTAAQKYKDLKSQTESAGMSVKEKSGKVVVAKKKGKKKK